MKQLCIVCNNSSHHKIYRNLLKCDNCGFIFADLNISFDEYIKLYNENYFTGNEYSNYLKDRRITEKNFQKKLKYILKNTSSLREKKLLEIGCAYGFFLNIARNYFDVTGIDITPEGTQFARKNLNLNVYTGDFLETEFNTQYDIICLWDTVEHILKLDEYFKKIDKLTQSGSMLFLTTNDIGSLNARFRRGNWRQIHPPTHIWYFSKKTIELFLKKYGFNIIEISYPGIYRSLDAMLCMLSKNKMLYKYIYEFLKKLKITKFDIYMNLYDIFLISAKKG